MKTIKEIARNNKLDFRDAVIKICTKDVDLMSTCLLFNIKSCDVKSLLNLINEYNLKCKKLGHSSECQSLFRFISKKKNHSSECGCLFRFISHKLGIEPGCNEKYEKEVYYTKIELKE